MVGKEQVRRFCATCATLLGIAAVIAGIVGLAVFLTTSEDATYSTTVTGVAGMDLSAARSSSTLSPVFNLTVRIDNARDKLSSACVKSLATAAVSYGGAFLGRGPVPQFCAGVTKVRERSATAWGDGVILPRFLRDKLAGELAAGEAAVDVQVTMPGACYQCSDTVLICSKARIGGDPAPCRKEDAYHRHPDEPAAGSTD